MKRLAAILAAAVLGSGCGDERCIGRVVVDWSSGFQAFDGAILDCASAGVEQVDIWVNGQFDFTQPCGAGAARVALFDGPNVVTVEGIDLDGVDGPFIAFRAEVSASGGSCREPRLAVNPAEGEVELRYSVPGDVCVDGSFIWFSVFDEIAGVVAAEVNARNVTSDYACGGVDGAPLPITFVLPAGSYTLDWVQEMVQVGPTWTVAARDCTPRPFLVAGASLTPVAPVLADATTACP